jgi:GDPmannose 4,6-dehydratase
MPAPKALITGIAGQDGAYLAALLLEKGYDVHGTVRSDKHLWRLQELGLVDRITLYTVDLMDATSVNMLLTTLKPRELYNVAAQSSVVASWEDPLTTVDVNALGTLRLLEAIRHHSPKTKFFQASSSELFGESRPEKPQDEHASFHPRSPYALSKLFAHTATITYRESFALFACSGILFSHESPLRDTHFVTRKVTDGVARIKCGLADSLTLGTLDAKRDWGFAGDVASAMWLMLQQEKAEEFVIATGQIHSVRDLVICAFREIGIRDWEPYVRLQSQKRPVELGELTGDIRKAKKVLGWEPSISFEELVSMMVRRDVERLSSAQP